MAKKVYSCEKVDLPFDKMKQLRETGKLQLGVNDGLAEKIVTLQSLKPTTTSASAAYKFWNFIALGGFLFSIYWSFVDAWWWFIVGFLAAGFIINSNKKGNAENVLDSAMVDPEFYEKVRNIGGWLYKLDETAASKYMKEK